MTPGTLRSGEPPASTAPMTETPSEPDQTEAAASREVDPRLLDLLVCPLTKTTLIYDRGRGELVSKPAGLAYPIRDGIPIMLPDEARELTEEERGP